MKFIEFNGVRYACTLSDRFRRHTPEELDAMRESAREHGIRVAIRVYHDTDLGLEDCVLDGEGRLTVAAELGLPLKRVPFFPERGMGTDAAYELAKVLNDARRHDDPEVVRRRRLEKVKELRREGKSIRAIAAETGVSAGQAARDLEAVRQLSRGETVDPEAVVGRDGKLRPATKTDEYRQLSRGETVDDDEFEERMDAAVDFLGGLANDDDEPEPLDDTPPKPMFDASRTTAPPPWKNRGGKPVDKDHPFCDVLKKCTALSAAITSALRGPHAEKLRAALLEVGLHPHRIPMLSFTSDVIDGDEVKKGTVRFVGLYALRSLVRDVGEWKKDRKAGEALKKFQGYLGESETAGGDE